jgi:hypothetical protein
LGETYIEFRFLEPAAIGADPMAPWAHPDPEAQAEGARIRRIMQGPPLPTPTLNPPDAAARRARLAEAQAARTETQGALEKAIAAQRRGEDLERAAQAEYDKFGDLDQKIADARAARIANWAQTGNGSLPPELFDIEPDLAAAAKLKAEAAERLSIAKDGSTLLRRLANHAQEAATEAANRVVYIAAEILAIEADAMAEDFVVMMRAAWVLHDKLTALTELWPGGAPLRCSSAVGAALRLTRDVYDADRRPGMPFAREHFGALWQEYFSRLLNDADAQFEWRPPRPEDHRAIMPRVAVPSFVPTSLQADRDLERRRIEAEAEARDAGPPPFVPEQAWTAAQKFRRDKAEREAMASLVERAEGAG